MAALLRSQLECPACGDVIASIHRHDFQTCKCGGLSIDGGRDYLRVSFNDKVGAELQSEGGMRRMDRSISIAGEHNNASAALALAIYKALWFASQRGAVAVTTPAVRAATAEVGNRKTVPMATVMAYLKMFADDDGPVERLGGSNAFKWLPKIALVERSDAP